MRKMKVVQEGQQSVLSKMTWRHPSLHGPCMVLKTKTVEVKALGDPPRLRFFLTRKRRRALLVTVLRREDAGPWLPPSEAFIPVPRYQLDVPSQAVTLRGGMWIGDRAVAEDAARNEGLPPTLIRDIYPKKGRPNPTALNKKYPEWPVVGVIQVYFALQKLERGRTDMVLLSGSKKAPVIVARAGKPLDPEAYSPRSPALVWWGGSGARTGVLNFDLGPRSLPRNNAEAAKLFRLLDLDTGLLNTILA